MATGIAEPRGSISCPSDARFLDVTPIRLALPGIFNSEKKTTASKSARSKGLLTKQSMYLPSNKSIRETLTHSEGTAKGKEGTSSPQLLHHTNPAYNNTLRSYVKSSNLDRRPHWRLLIPKKLNCAADSLMGNRHPSRKHSHLPETTVFKQHKPWKLETAQNHKENFRKMSQAVLGKISEKKHNFLTSQGSSTETKSGLSYSEVVEISKWQEENPMNDSRIFPEQISTKDEDSKEQSRISTRISVDNLNVPKSSGKTTNAIGKYTSACPPGDVAEGKAGDTLDMLSDDGSPIVHSCSDTANSKMDLDGDDVQDCHSVDNHITYTNMYQSGDDNIGKENTDSCFGKKVQWKLEVDVIYYAGDAEGGPVLSRAVEPLHEEEEQQSRNWYAKKCSRTINTRHYPFTEPWLSSLYIK